MNLPLRQTFTSHGERTALIVDGEHVSYGELDRRIRTCATALAARQIGPGSRVGVLMPNSVDMIVTILAAWELGSVVLPINTRYRAHDLCFVVADSAIELLVTTEPTTDAPDLRERIAEAVPGACPDESLNCDAAPALRRVVTWPSLTSDARSTTPTARTTRTIHDHDLLLIYTSGTTANPKGCIHDLCAFQRTAHETAAVMELDHSDVVWDPLPLFHTGGLLPLLGALEHGATFCTSAHFDATSALRTLEHERVSVAYPAFSTILTALMDNPSFDTTNLSGLRWIVAIGPESLLRRVQEAIPNAVQVSCYGCTEIGGVVVYNRISDDPQTRATTAGVSFPGVEVSIIDPITGDRLPSGERGEIVVRADSLLRGYHQESRSPLDQDGRFHTGDLGHIDGQGNLLFEGRLKDVLKVGGENVAASEIELVLASHPAVTLAAVVPAPDDRLVEVPVAFVELKPGRDTSAEDLIQFCATRLASFKVPRQVRIVQEWPMSATKVQKFRLRESLEAEWPNSRHHEAVTS